MFLKLAYLPSKLRFSDKYLFQEHQISAGQLSADSSSTETLRIALTGPLHDPVTRYGLNYARLQVTQWDFQNKGTPEFLCFVSPPV